MSVRHESAAERKAHELFQCYRRGWRHGCIATAMDPRFVNHQRVEIGREYVKGYSDGRDATVLASARAAERLGYDPRFSMLRADPPKDPPAATQPSSEPDGRQSRAAVLRAF